MNYTTKTLKFARVKFESGDLSTVELRIPIHSEKTFKSELETYMRTYELLFGIPLHSPKFKQFSYETKLFESNKPVFVSISRDLPQDSEFLWEGTHR